MKNIKKITFFVLGLNIILSLNSCSIGLEDKKQEAYNQGYSTGLAKGEAEGKLKAEKKYTALLEKEKNDFENELKVKQAEYEKIVSYSYNSSYGEGQKSMQKDMDEIIDVSDGKKKKKRKNDKWNAGAN